MCRPRGHILAAVLTAALAGAAPAVAIPAGPPPHDEPEGVPSLEALPISDPITLDGLLTETAWQQAQVGSGFTQREPEQGKPASEPTEVRVAYTPTTLYIAIRALEAHPDEIVAEERQRDGSGAGRGGRLERDDSVVVVLDTFHDHRNAFFFETNPNGARSDALITDEGRDRNFQWDGVWRVAARRIPEGWSVEMAIPFATLRFDPSADTWGMNVRRHIRHRNEEVYWATVMRDADVFRISRAGHLTGLRGLRAGLNLRIKPFVVASSGESFQSESRIISEDAQWGADIRWGLTHGLTLDLTYNTDFAQVEVDEQRVNLTRFSLFFPEKREFFLENAGIFEFGPGRAGPEAAFRPPLLKLFFSRRIGISPAGAPVPITGGARLTGRVGGWSVGLLDVQTDAFGEPASAPLLPETNWAVVRIKRNAAQRSTVGAILTNRQAADGDFNRVLGFDADLNPHRRLNLSAFWATSRDAGQRRGDDSVAGAGIRWRGPVWRWSFDFLEVGERFNPEMGFLLRRGIRRYNPDLSFDPRPELPGIRNLSFGARADIITGTDGTLETVDATLRFFGLRFDSEDFVTLFAGANFEQLFRPFEIRPGIVIPPGRYEFRDLGMFFNTNPSRAVSGRGFVVRGDFYNGERFTSNITLQFRPSGLFRWQATWDRNDVDLPAGSFVTNIYRHRIDLSFSPNLFTNTFLQYNDADDLLSLNFRFDWIYTPGADLFIVYNHVWDAPSLGSRRTRDRALIVKFTYLLAL